jgi:hypothetical protein
MSRRSLPLTLLALAVLLQLVFQTVQLVRESQSLAAINRSQDLPLQETTRLHDATNSLAGDIYQLAQSGNAAAKQVLAEMAKQNVVLRAAGAPAAAPEIPPDTAPAPAAPPAPAAKP